MAALFGMPGRRSPTARRKPIIITLASFPVILLLAFHYRVVSRSFADTATGETYLRNFERAARMGDTENAFDILEQVRGRLFGLNATPQGISSERPNTIKGIQESLRTDELLLEYVLDDPQAYCLWISKDGAGIEILPSGRRWIEQLAWSYLTEIRAKHVAIHLEEHLFRILIAPIARTAKSPRLIIVPAGLLHLLPFDALRDQDGVTLLETRTVTYLPTGRVLQSLRNEPASKHTSLPFLGVGDVSYQGVRSGPFTTPISDLPQTGKEILDVNRILGGGGHLLLNSAATETAFKSQPLEDFAIIHLAVHGVADNLSSARSALILGIDPKSQDDGLLRADEIMLLHFNADLVTLSACDTGIGTIEGEGGIRSLAEPFLARGAKAVVASLWRADDAYSREIMKRFYEHLKKGEDKGKALRQAKLDSMARYGRDMPTYYWGTFVLVGDGASAIRFGEYRPTVSER